MQNNATVDGSLRNVINSVKNTIEQDESKIIFDNLGYIPHESIDDIISYMNIDGYWISVGYCLRCVFASQEGAYIIGLDISGTTPGHTAVGTQLLFSTWGGIRIRRKVSETWSEWKDLFL